MPVLLEKNIEPADKFKQWRAVVYPHFKNLPKMLALANIYLINWEATDYYGNMDLNDYEYLAYLKHNVRLMQWIEEHKDELEKLKMVS